MHLYQGGMGRHVTTSSHRSRTYSRRWAVAVLAMLGGLMLAGDPPQAAAQSGERRQDLVETLLRTLIEAELERRDIPRTASRTPGVINTVSTTPAAELLRIRKALNDFSQEADRLTTALNADRTRVPGIRHYMSDVLKIRARSTMLAQNAAQMNDVSAIRAEFEIIDRDWRLLAYQLGQIHDLDRTIQLSLKRLNDHDQTVCDLLAMQAQLDRQELIRRTAALSAELQSLLQDIEIELSNSQQRTALLLDGRRVQQQVNHIGTTVGAQTDYDTILAEYKQFQTLWHPFATRLRPVNNRHFERSLRRVSENDRAIHELLWLPRGIDRPQLLHLTSVLKKDVDEFFVRTPLKLLISLPNAERILAIADQFYGVCDNFDDCVNGGDNHAELVDAYRYIEDAWLSFNAAFQPLKSEAALQVLKQIEQSILALKGAMEIQDGFDRRRAIQSAASLENLAERLNSDTKRWLDRSNLNFRSEAVRESAQFAAAAQRFHAAVQTGASMQQLRTDVGALNEQWRRVHAHTLKCNTSDRDQLLRVSAQIINVLVDLQTLLLP